MHAIKVVDVESLGDIVDCPINIALQIVLKGRKVTLEWAKDPTAAGGGGGVEKELAKHRGVKLFVSVSLALGGV